MNVTYLYEPLRTLHIVGISPIPLNQRAMPSGCHRFVFACFKRVERWGDKLTGAAGPFFVAIAALLLVIGTLCFRTFLCFSL